MEIRKISSDEGLILREVRLHALADSPYAFGATLSDEKKKSLDEFISHAKVHAVSEISTTFLAIESTKPVGQIGAYFNKTNGKAFICAMWVSPSYHRNSVGEQLVSKAILWLKEREASKTYAWVTNSNIRAIKFYKSIGFTSTQKQQVLASNLELKETLYIYDVNNG